MSPNDQGTEPVGPTTVIERPPPGLARGHYPAKAWVVSMLGAAIVTVGLAYLAFRWFRRVK